MASDGFHMQIFDFSMVTCSLFSSLPLYLSQAEVCKVSQRKQAHTHSHTHCVLLHWPLSLAEIMGRFFSTSSIPCLSFPPFLLSFCHPFFVSVVPFRWPTASWAELYMNRRGRNFIFTLHSPTCKSSSFQTSSVRKENLRMISKLVWFKWTVWEEQE